MILVMIERGRMLRGGLNFLKGILCPAPLTLMPFLLGASFFWKQGFWKYPAPSSPQRGAIQLSPPPPTLAK